MNPLPWVSLMIAVFLLVLSLVGYFYFFTNAPQSCKGTSKGSSSKGWSW